MSHGAIKKKKNVFLKIYVDMDASQSEGGGICILIQRMSMFGMYSIQLRVVDRINYCAKFVCCIVL